MSVTTILYETHTSTCMVIIDLNFQFPYTSAKGFQFLNAFIEVLQDPVPSRTLDLNPLVRRNIWWSSGTLDSNTVLVDGVEALIQLRRDIIVRPCKFSLLFPQARDLIRNVLRKRLAIDVPRP